VTELIQHELTVENLSRELQKILPGQEERTRIKKEYQELFDLLSANQNASQKAAEIIINLKDK
jgi:lipid-A-disaccharide synthase